jgi:general secretion pathway protein G
MISRPTPDPSPESRELLRHPRNRAGFTLIEIIVVIIVLGALATIVAPNVFRHIGTSRKTTARTQIEMIGAALDAYQLDNNGYPTSEQGLGALRKEPETEPRPSAWNGPYLRKDVPRDPWGRPYLYRSPGAPGGEPYELLSLGRDGREGGDGENADILSWQ